ncbi:MAG: YebC/PmpR family DNA-binding transcriptional regulator [Candidatus Dojkabacteria bacterium]|nr:MAG: YebC/PmpR family DNA-binding transcriptional regulator [Candidatus Dojkabacteria bacterium]
MAGHSHWSNIQRKKGKEDHKRGVLFTRAAMQIILAAREGGGDPNHNLALRIAIDNAKMVNMPKDNIERAIQKGAGTGEGSQLSKALYEGYGPGNVPVIVYAITDSKNRTVSELRSIFTEFGGAMGEPGSVQWQFTESGLIEVKCAVIKKGEKFGEPDEEVVKNGEEAMLDLMDVPDIMDINLDDSETPNICYVLAPMNQLAQITQAIKSKGYVVLSSGQHFSANDEMVLDASKLESFRRFIEKMEEHPDVQKVWHTANNE